MHPLGLRTMHNCTGKGQQQFTCPTIARSWDRKLSAYHQTRARKLSERRIWWKRAVNYSSQSSCWKTNPSSHGRGAPISEQLVVLGRTEIGSWDQKPRLTMLAMANSKLQDCWTKARRHQEWGPLNIMNNPHTVVDCNQEMSTWRYSRPEKLRMFCSYVQIQKNS
jgi:hypothetical protein